MSGSHVLGARILGAVLALCLFAPAGAAFAQDADATVSMQVITFVPASVHVPAGGTVLWNNDSQLAHTITADDGSFDSGLLDPGGSFSMSFDTPGMYQYFCQPHGSAGLHGMSGTIIVDDPVADEVPVQAAPLKPNPPKPDEYYPDH